MSKIILAIITAVSFSTAASAYSIGGAYARLTDCSWGKWGYEYGNIGTYEVNGQYYTVFFGSSSCQY